MLLLDESNREMQRRADNTQRLIVLAALLAIVVSVLSARCDSGGSVINNYGISTIPQSAASTPESQSTTTP